MKKIAILSRQFTSYINFILNQANNLVSLKQKEAAMGWIMLNNEHRILHHEGDSIALIGVENWGAPPFTGN